MLGSIERRLLKNLEHANVYGGKGSVTRKLSKEEIASYDSPVFHISQHEVLKPTSSSTLVE